MRDNLIVSAKTKAIMKSIGEFRAGISGKKAVWVCIEFVEFHVTKAADDLGTSKTRTKLFLQVAKYDQRKEASCEVSGNPNVPLKIYRSCFKFMLRPRKSLCNRHHMTV